MWLLHVEMMAACVWSQNGKLKGGCRKIFYCFPCVFCSPAELLWAGAFVQAPQHHIKTTKGMAHGRAQGMREWICPFAGKIFQKKDWECLQERSPSFQVGSGRQKLLSSSSSSLEENQQKHTVPSISLLLLGWGILFCISSMTVFSQESKPSPRAPVQCPGCSVPALLGPLVDSCVTEPRIPALCFSLPH